jgi:hypothetical protein
LKPPTIFATWLTSPFRAFANARAYTTYGDCSLAIRVSISAIAALSPVRPIPSTASRRTSASRCPSCAWKTGRLPGWPIFATASSAAIASGPFL